MEMDVIENNGKCAMATTIHTFATDGQPGDQDCDRWGCQVSALLPSAVFHVKASFGADGSLSVSLNDGKKMTDYSPYPSDASNAVVVSTMSSVGAAIESSQWSGWAPPGPSGDCPSGGDLDSSVVTISNVTVFGDVVQGPEPTAC